MTALSRANLLLARRGPRRADRAFVAGTRISGSLLVATLAAIALQLTISSWPAWVAFGADLMTKTIWDPVREVYGALPFIVGTLASSAIALVLAAPIGILAAIYLAEFAPRRAAPVLTFVIELLAAIPSVVIGLWGLFILAPALQTTVYAWLIGALGWIPIFRGPSFGVGLLTAGIILAIMILPTIVSISREVIAAVPDSQREAMLGLGATRWEAVRKVVLPYARSGIVGAIILGLGRALGETMAVTMVIGNGQDIPTSVFDPAQTIASKIAVTFNEASGGLQTQSLIGIGLILLVMTLLLNVVARLLVGRVTRGPGR